MQALKRYRLSKTLPKPLVKAARKARVDILDLSGRTPRFSLRAQRDCNVELTHVGNHWSAVVRSPLGHTLTSVDHGMSLEAEDPSLGSLLLDVQKACNEWSAISLAIKHMEPLIDDCPQAPFDLLRSAGVPELFIRRLGDESAQAVLPNGEVVQAAVAARLVQFVLVEPDNELIAARYSHSLSKASKMLRDDLKGIGFTSQ